MNHMYTATGVFPVTVVAYNMVGRSNRTTTVSVVQPILGKYPEAQQTVGLSLLPGVVLVN